MPGTFIPNPSDPDPSGGEENPDPRRRLKLKRIGPHVRKQEPVPPPPSEPAPPPRPSTSESSPPSPPKAGDSPRKYRLRPQQVALLAAPLLLVVLIGFLLATILQPSSSPETPASAPAPAEEAVASSAGEPEPQPDPVRTVIAANNPGSRPEADLETYLNRFTAQDLAVSSSPRGLFAGPVFIPEGAFINRDLGLVLARVEEDPGNSSFTVTTESGTSRSFPLSSAP